MPESARPAADSGKAAPGSRRSEGSREWEKWLSNKQVDGEGRVDPASERLTKAELGAAVRYTLQVIRAAVPGRSVELRVIPYGAVQIVRGAEHRRGTPPAIVEMEAETWLRLASGQLDWLCAVEDGLVDASGENADLRPYLPLLNLER